jgi:hypothetical protein
MYTQNYTHNQGETKIISFPNKESIIRMKLLESKSETKTAKMTPQDQISNKCYDNILLLCTLMTMTENENTISTLFTLITGILLSN